MKDIEKVEVGKWVELHITLRDGTFISKQITPELDNTDWKWSSMDSYLDEDWNPIDEDELFSTLTLMKSLFKQEEATEKDLNGS